MSCLSVYKRATRTWCKTSRSITPTLSRSGFQSTRITTAFTTTTRSLTFGNFCAHQYHQELRRYTTSSMASNPATVAKLKTVLTSELLSELRRFWFEHLESDEDERLPSVEKMMRWFKVDEEFDKACRERFSHALRAIKETGISTGQPILDAVQPRDTDGLVWVSLIILLDQIPRNCYRHHPNTRTDDARSVFEFFDPLALSIALRALSLDVPDKSSLVREYLGVRQWFYLPLMHSEDISIHEQAEREYSRLEEMMMGKEKEVEFVRMQSGFEKRHKVIVERFGRYPHRNEVLGREMRGEEREYLDGGGDRF